jgi:hypothetical protein
MTDETEFIKGKTLYSSRSRSQYLRRFAERPITHPNDEIKMEFAANHNWGKMAMRNKMARKYRSTKNHNESRPSGKLAVLMV